MSSLLLTSNFSGLGSSNIYSGVSNINWSSVSAYNSNNQSANDTYVGSAARLGLLPSFNAGNGLVRIQPSDEIFYNPEDGSIYVRQGSDNNYLNTPIDNSNLLFSGLNGDQMDGYNYNNSEIGDQVFYDTTTGKIYVQKQGVNGPEYVELNNQGNIKRNSQGSTQRTSPVNVNTQAEVSRISSRGQTFAALNIPYGLTTSPMEVNGVFPGFGDRTGASIAASIYCEAAIYTQLQKTLSIINYLNTAPGGTSPNPNFSYIAGRPSYAQDTPEGRRAQDKVFAMLRTNIITQLTRVAQQLRDAINGIKQQRTLAETYKKTQDGDVKKFVDAAFGGGGGGG